MKAAAAVAEILKREGVKFLIGYPVNPIIEAAAEADIRTIIVRQERTGLHMADAVSRISSGERIGVFAMQHGPGSENAFGGVAQAYGDSVPIIVLPGGYPRRITNIEPNFNSFLNFQHVTKWCEQVIVPDAVVDAMRRAFTQVKNGRPRPVLIEFPVDLLREDVPEPINYSPTPRLKSGGSARRLRVAEALVAAQRPVIYAGQGVHYARAWQVLRPGRAPGSAGDDEPAGQSAFRESPPVAHQAAAPSRSSSTTSDELGLIFGIGCVSHDELRRVRRVRESPIRPWTRPTSTKTCRLISPGRRRRPTLQALLVEVKDRLRRAARPPLGRRRRSKPPERVAGQVDPAAPGHEAALRTA
jgi:acetolactate synthase-1/2/3 large subunit